MMARRNRRLANQKGLWAEVLSAVYLMANGYWIRARRYKTPVGEIDLIVSRGRTLAFVEVKAREDADVALQSVSPHQRRRIEKAAEHFLSRHEQKKTGEINIRFDLIVVPRTIRVIHIKGAWLSGD